MKHKLVCFDVDGTLIDNVEYSWSVFHDFFQVDPKRREKAKKAFYSNEISYLEWAEHDLNLWMEKNAKKQDFIKAIKHANLQLMEGALETLSELKKRNIKLAIISGSISIILEHFIPNYKEIFDDIFISWIDFDEQGSIKKINATSFDMDQKSAALKQIAEREHLSLKECVFVGDHDNDLKIAEEAGLSIAFNAHSEELKKISDITIAKKDLREILKYIS
ncbi:HAD-IB family phosphatase [Candidatus Woesearchaeota archaeon]|nr:HAD-IB family phosphatase [Candidatus Woesearchaeota archaeon]